MSSADRVVPGPLGGYDRTVVARVARQLQHLGREVLQHGRDAHGRLTCGPHATPTLRMQLQPVFHGSSLNALDPGSGR